MQFAWAADLEDADISERAHHPSQMQPLANPLQFGRTPVFLRTQRADCSSASGGIRIRLMRDPRIRRRGLVRKRRLPKLI
jgi:hypothetical protein